MSMKKCVYSLLLAACCSAQSAQAEVKEYIRDYNYHAAAYDTETTCRVNAIDGVKRELLDELGTYVGSVVKLHQDSLGNSYMSQDVVNITAGIVAMKVLDEKWKQPVYFVKAGMKADPDDVLVKLKALRADLEMEKALRESYEELQNSRNEVAKLKAQLAQLMGTQDKQVPAKTVVPVIAMAAPAPALVPSPVVQPVIVAPVVPQQPVPAVIEAPVANPAVLAPVENAAAPVVEKPVPQLPEPVVPVTVPVVAPTVASLTAQYVQAVQDVEVGAAFQRALAARMRGDFGALLREMSMLAEKGYASAQFRMGWLYERGVGVAQDFVKAREWYAKAMANGDADAIARTGLLYELGLGVEKNYDKAAAYYQRAIAADSALGYAHMGYLYETGKGVPRDREKAAEHYRRGMEKGDYLAMTRLGFLYQLGRGVGKDEYKAVELYKQAVDHGQPLAMTRLGQMYNLGQGGVPQDHAKALELIRESVRYNLPGAFAFMGFMYENGWEVPQDYAEARRLYEKAAELEAPFAEFRLGIMYRDGLGVSRDRQKAMYWLERAADKGEDKAVAILERMRRF
jgi:TPR repeat protein